MTRQLNERERHKDTSERFEQSLLSWQTNKRECWRRCSSHYTTRNKITTESSEQWKNCHLLYIDKDKDNQLVTETISMYTCICWERQSNNGFAWSAVISIPSNSITDLREGTGTLIDLYVCKGRSYSTQIKHPVFYASASLTSRRDDVKNQG